MFKKSRLGRLGQINSRQPSQPDEATFTRYAVIMVLVALFFTVVLPIIMGVAK